MDNIVGCRCSVSLITQLRRCIFSKKKKNRHLKLEIALAIPASNNEKYNSNNSAGKGLTRLSHVFDGEKIQRISKDVHLGSIVGECSNEIRIKVTTDDFIRRANTVMSQFKLAPHSIK